MSALLQQRPIESRLNERLADQLNAEIAAGHVQSLRDAVQWLQQTFWYIRLRRNPRFYGLDWTGLGWAGLSRKVTSAESSRELTRAAISELVWSYAKSAVQELERYGLCFIEWDAEPNNGVYVDGTLRSLDFGRVASQFYLDCKSVYGLGLRLRAWLGLATPPELLASDLAPSRWHSTSSRRDALLMLLESLTSVSDFAQIRVRESELPLLERCAAAAAALGLQKRLSGSMATSSSKACILTHGSLASRIR